MKKKILPFAVLFFLWSVVWGQKTDSTTQIVLKLKSEVNSYAGRTYSNQKLTGNSKIDSITQSYHAEITKRLLGRKSRLYVYLIKFPKGTNIQHVISEYYQTNEVDYAEPDHIGSGGGGKGVKPNDQFYFRQWGLENNGTFSQSLSIAGADIDIEDAWGVTQGDSNIIIGIIDSGIKFDHPEFSKRVWTNYSEIPNNQIDDDSNGYIDDVRGWNFVNEDNNPIDDFGHGTNVAGIIGANGNNSIGYSGVDWNCKLMVLKGLNSSNVGLYSWWSEAIYYAVDNGANIINMSLGGLDESTVLHNAIDYALNNNVVVVACMMNTNSNTLYYPAAFHGVIAVGSTNSDDTRSHPFFWDSASGSNFGKHISVVAPGNYIYGIDYKSNTNYDSFWGGTSQAAPYVSGLSALLFAQNRTRSNAQIKSIIEMTAEDQIGDSNEDSPGWDPYYGFGRINAYNALTTLTSVEQLNSSKESLFLSPNPNQGSFRVTIPSTASQIRIINSLGNTIYLENFSGPSPMIFQNIDCGIYYVQITTIEGTCMNIKAVVQK